jgi:hypothetical protein
MTFKYKKKKLVTNLVFGILWVVFSAGSIYLDETPNWINGANLGVALTFLLTYLYQANFQYISIKNGVIKETSLFGTSLLLNEITSFKKFAGDYIIKSRGKEIYVNTELIDPDSLLKLIEFMNGLELKDVKLV